MDAAKYRRFWHFGFFAAPGLAEALVADRERLFLSWFMRQLAFDPYALPAEDIDEYASHLAAPGALRGGFEHYRRSRRTGQPGEQPDEVSMPVLAIGGDHSMADQVARMMQPLAEDIRSAVLDAAATGSRRSGRRNWGAVDGLPDRSECRVCVSVAEGGTIGWPHCPTKATRCRSFASSRIHGISIYRFGISAPATKLSLPILHI